MLLTLLMSCFTTSVFAQGFALVQGKVKNVEGEALTGAHVSIEDSSQVIAGITSDFDGKYELKVPINRALEIHFSYLGYDTLIVPVNYPSIGKYTLDIQLEESSFLIGPVEIVKKDKVASTYSFDAEDLQGIVGPMASVERVAVMEAGVVSNNELSSSYSVRGGNFDENLVYLNDFEVYRPQLTRSGVQEGLSILNPDMVSNLQFFAGGFAANYGDKMSSVLDVQYKKPKDFGTKGTLGLLGGSLLIEGTALDKRTTYLIGGRHRNNAYLLNSMDVQGAYKPVFNDVQAYLTHQIGTDWQWDGLFYLSDNNYINQPQSQVTRFGDIQNANNFYVEYRGQEISRFRTLTAGSKFKYFNEKTGYTFKWITSAFNSRESETFDVLGRYVLSNVENNLGSDDFGQTEFGNFGIGAFHNYARNYLNINVLNSEIRNYHIFGNHSFQWGGKLQAEQVDDKMYEWTRIDSAGYSIPYNTDSVLLNMYRRNDHSMTSYRASAYVQDEWRKTLNDSSNIALNLGLRTTVWTYNEQINVSPRMQLFYRPNWERNFSFRLAAGMYHQPPFYRELRRLDGSINANVLAQRATHTALGMDYEFKMWDRPFKFTSEIYYKWLYNLNTYEVDNVKVRYYANNDAKGYATGIDFRLNGEFVPGAESWFNLSFMRTMEDILTDSYIQYYNDTGAVINPVVYGYDAVADQDTIYPGYIPRPTDQLMTFNIFFQDYVRGNENIKVHLNFIFGTGFKFGPPDFNRYKDTLRLPMYRRVDLGFSGLLLNGKKAKYAQSFYRHIDNVWATLEVFNLMDVANTVSYLWIRDISSRLHAVSNHLTSRLVNLKLVVKI